MCGIIGIWKREGMITFKNITKLMQLIMDNSSRGTLAFGVVTPNSIYKDITNPTLFDWKEFLYATVIGQKYCLIHLRSPTGDAMNNLEVTQPLQNRCYTVLHNGILIEWNKKFKSDTYYILDEMTNKLILDALDRKSVV